MAYLDYDGLTEVQNCLGQIYQRQNNLYLRFDPIDGDIEINHLVAADETTASALSTFNINVNVRTPDEMGIFHPGVGAVDVFYAMENRLYLAWMSNGVLEIGLVRLSVDVQTKAITYSALGHTSMAYGVAEVDTEWTIEALPDDTPYELPPATASTLGGVKVGTGLSVETDGTLSVPGLTVLEYGKSTWADFQAAYNANKLVYCRYKMSANEVRMAFLAYTFPGKAEFQYYRTVGTKSDTQQGDEVYIYTLVKTKSAWTTTVRQNYAKIVAGTGLTSTYTYSASTNAGTLTLKSTPATTSALGGVKVGTGLSVATDGTLSTSYELPPATESTLGGVTVGEGLSVTSDGQLSVTDYYQFVLLSNFQNALDDAVRFIVIAADATSAAVVGNAFGETPAIKMPNDFTNAGQAFFIINNRVYLSWMDGTKLEVAPLNDEIDVATQVITIYARGRLSMAYGVMGVDESWTITANQ